MAQDMIKITIQAHKNIVTGEQVEFRQFEVPAASKQDYALWIEQNNLQREAKIEDILSPEQQANLDELKKKLVNTTQKSKA